MAKLIKLVDKLPILPFKDVKNNRDFLYIENLLVNLKRLIELNASGIVMLTDGKALTIGELVSRIIKALGKKKWQIKPIGVFLGLLQKFKPGIKERLYDSLVINCSSTDRKYRIKPVISSEDGLKIMVDSYIKSKAKS